MKFLSTFLVVGAALCFGTAQAATLQQAAPDFSLSNTQGEQVSLADLRGKFVVLEWTNHLCPFVVKHYDSGNMQAQQKQATDDGVIWLSIISSAPGKQGHVSAEQARELTSSRGAAPSHVLFDGDGAVGRAYGAKTTPHMYLIDPQGTLLYMGGIDSIPSADQADLKKATQYLPVALRQAQAGEPVDPAQTRPYGCSVKY